MITTRPATRADEDHLLEIYAIAARDRDPEIRTQELIDRPSDVETRGQNPSELTRANSFTPDTDLSGWMKEKETRVIVAEDCQTILGWGVFFLDKTPLATIFVDPEAPRIKTRDRLLAHAEGIAADVGITHLSLLTY